MDSTVRFIDLFAGIGGFHYGIERASSNRNFLQSKESEDLQKNISDAKERQIRATCVYSNEWDKYANSVYRRHYGKCDNRDIRTVKAEEIPDHDLLCGGFPCQAFSVAGKRAGFDDTRGTLFFEIARILKEKQPRLCLLENVKGLLSHDNGRTIKIIFATLTELGYDLQWQVLNSKDFGVPQNRERILIVGHLRGTRRPEVFPIRGEGQGFNKELASTAIDANYWKGIDNHGQRTAIGTWRTHKDGQGFRRVQSGLSPTIPARAREDGSGQPVIMAVDTRQQGPARFTENVATLSATDYKEPKAVFKNMRIRRLTPIECERLQGFPDDWTKYGADGEVISDTQRYKMCGNAVTTNVITAIARRLYE